MGYTNTHKSKLTTAPAGHTTYVHAPFYHTPTHTHRQVSSTNLLLQLEVHVLYNIGGKYIWRIRNFSQIGGF